MAKKGTKLHIIERGLPPDYDPHYFYEYRIMKRAKEAAGIEGLVYQILPWRLIRSFAFAIDPFSGFKTSTGYVAPGNRNRTTARISVLDTRKYETIRYVESAGSIPNYLGSNGRFGPVQANPGYPSTTNNTVSLLKQDALWNLSLDTSKSTRPLGYDLGELDLSRVQVFSTPRTLSLNSYTYVSLGQFDGWTYPSISYTRSNKQYSIGPTAAVLRNKDYVQIRESEKAILLLTMQKNALTMYKDINPQHRNYSLFRSIVELRDIPRSIASMQVLARKLIQFERDHLINLPSRLRRLIMSPNSPVSEIPNQYLSYHFGWKLLVRDVTDLLVKPEKISKQIDFLLERSGKATTYRLKRNYTSSSVGGPGFLYDRIDGESSVSGETRLLRNIELRMVINTTFDFPRNNVPAFRKQLFLRKLGAYPSITDIYNLVPWTWLVDWFTGLGNYVDVIDQINQDKSLINYGFITGTSSIELITAYRSKAYAYDNIRYMPEANVSTEKVIDTNHSSVALINLQIRKSLSRIMSVNCINEPTSLTSFQQSIIGALLAQRLRR